MTHPPRADAPVAGLLLAAGGGRRFGRPKALVEFEGQSLVERGVAVLAAAGCSPTVVVLGARADEVLTACRLGAAETVVNDAWSTGMASSLQVGLARLETTAAQACVITLVDQPLISPAALQRLIDVWRTGGLAVAAGFAGVPRNPVVLDRTVWGDVSDAAVGDEGARGWMRANPELVRVVGCDDVASNVDVDTPEDLRQVAESAALAPPVHAENPDAEFS